MSDAGLELLILLPFFILIPGVSLSFFLVFRHCLLMRKKFLDIPTFPPSLLGTCFPSLAVVAVFT